MPTATATASLTITDPHTADRRVFWRGLELTEVIGVAVHSDNRDDNRDDGQVRLRVKNTTNFDTTYVEMQSYGIAIRKENR